MNWDAGLLAFALSLLAASHGASQLLVSHLGERLGRSPALLMVALTTTLATSVLAAFAGAWLGAMVIGAQRGWLAAAALLSAAILLALKPRLVLPEEPTRSLGAIAIALGAKQVLDPPRLTIFASAAMLAAPWHAAAGGGAAACLALLTAWSRASGARAIAGSRALRIFASAVLFAAAALIVWIGYSSDP